MNIVRASWKTLDSYVTNLRNKNIPSGYFWREIDRRPMSVDHIKIVINNGCSVRFRELSSGVFGFLLSERGRDIIEIRNDLDPYERDKTLFHELAHLYHAIYVRNYHRNGRLVSDEEYIQLEATTEWLGRKARADPELLRHAVLSFGLEPHIYDQASYAAFKDQAKQLWFPFMEDLFPLRMDY